MDSEALSWMFTPVAFGALGWSIASRRSRPASPWAYVALFVAAILGCFVGVDTRLVDAYGFRVLLNWAIVACCLGGFVGLLARGRKLPRALNA